MYRAGAGAAPHGCLGPEWPQLHEADQVSRHLWVGNLGPDADRARLLNVAQVGPAGPTALSSRRWQLKICVCKGLFCVRHQCKLVSFDAWVTATGFIVRAEVAW